MQNQGIKYVFSEEEIKHLSGFFLLLFEVFQRVKNENQEMPEELASIESDK